MLKLAPLSTYLVQWTTCTTIPRPRFQESPGFFFFSFLLWVVTCDQQYIFCCPNHPLLASGSPCGLTLRMPHYSLSTSMSLLQWDAPGYEPVSSAIFTSFSPRACIHHKQHLNPLTCTHVLCMFMHPLQHQMWGALLWKWHLRTSSWKDWKIRWAQIGFLDLCR